MAEEGVVIGCHSVEQWDQHLQLAIQTKKLAVVDFTASWCGPCRMIAPIFAELAKKFPNVIFLKVDVDELKSVARDWAIEAMPTFIFLKEGTIVDKIVGANKDDLPKKIGLHLSK
ncbi:Thioredoxin H-type 2 [Apostasia shenzhenica]|uniref:Phloem sap 13 kDa protein 1 n=1 Tax=Apostasia shenzhenica TaxID=1088818 RepID=A0A2H9ZUI5_9ASPA|nr:Thioredoxin H-type 2 [Apostasia shenzhenica]